MIERVEKLLAHTHQRRGAARRQIEPPQQLLAARLGGAMHLGRRGLSDGISLPGRNRGIEPRPVWTEAVSQRLEEGDARSGGQFGVLGEDFAGERRARRLAAARQQFLAQLGRASPNAPPTGRGGRGRGRAAPGRAR